MYSYQADLSTPPPICREHVKRLPSPWHVYYKNKTKNVLYCGWVRMAYYSTCNNTTTIVIILLLYYYTTYSRITSCVNIYMIVLTSSFALCSQAPRAPKCSNFRRGWCCFTVVFKRVPAVIFGVASPSFHVVNISVRGAADSPSTSFVPTWWPIESAFWQSCRLSRRMKNASRHIYTKSSKIKILSTRIYKIHHHLFIIRFLTSKQPFVSISRVG